MFLECVGNQNGGRLFQDSANGYRGLKLLILSLEILMVFRHHGYLLLGVLWI